MGVMSEYPPKPFQSQRCKVGRACCHLKSASRPDLAREHVRAVGECHCAQAAAVAAGRRPKNIDARKRTESRDVSLR